MQIVERENDYYEPRFSGGSMSCFFPPLALIDSSRKSSYDKLQQQPLRLAVLKLDGSSFGIEVTKLGTVSELKRAVEAAFDHLPKIGPGRVSWEHLWGQFCLCHEGQKLLTDGDYISMLGIKDGDQLQFVHHASNTCNFVRIKSREGDPDVDNILRISNGYKDGRQSREEDDADHIENIEENQDGDLESEGNIASSRREYRLSDLFKGWFPYRNSNTSRKRLGERSCSSRISRNNMLGGFKNRLRFSSDRYDFRRVSWKRK